MLTGKYVAVDTETTGLHRWCSPFAFSFANEKGETAYFEMAVDPFTRQPIGKPDKPIKRLLENKSVIKVFHNAKFDIRMLRAVGIETKGRFHDTMHLAHACRSDDLKGLKPLAVKYLGISAEDQDELHEAAKRARRYGKKHKWNIGQKVFKSEDPVKSDYWMPSAVVRLDPEYAEEKGVDGTACQRYAVQDAIRTMKLFQMYWEWMNSDEHGTQEVCEIYQTEMKLLPIVMAMEDRGLHLNKEVLHQKKREVNKLLRDIEGEFPGVNLNPSGTLRNYLFTEKGDGLGLKPLSYGKQNKKGVCPPSVDAKTIDYYAGLNPKVGRIRTYRKASKLIGTYLDAYDQVAVKDAERYFVHCNLNQIGAATGRFSSSGPNLHNVPNRPDQSPILYMARYPFCPRPGYWWYAIDKRQIEARIFADNANEETMLEAFAEGRDVYAELAMQITDITGVGADLDFKVWRDITKHNFLGRLYGMGVYLLAARCGISIEESKEVLGGMDEAMPRIKGYMRELMKQAARDGEIMTRYGRLLSIDPDFAYKAVAWLCQSEAADLIKRAMIRMHKKLRSLDVDAHMILQIHDEIIIEAKKSLCTKPFVRMLKETMEDDEGMFDVSTPVEIKRIVGPWSKPQKVAA